MNVFSEIEPCRNAVREAQKRGGLVGLVPTMGALHEGHLSLVRAARTRCTTVAVTIFVNPSQFGPDEDLDAYPRTSQVDLPTCESEGVDIVFTPSVATMYPPGTATTVHVGGLTEVLCGRWRPGHFAGVTTVVAKLFNILPADIAFFGEKDYQQFIVVRQLARDLDMPIEVVACPTVREDDGLALSSRNAYLSAQERKQAASLNRALFTAARRAASGGRSASKLTDGIRAEILSAGQAEIEYVDVVDENTLKIMTTIDRPARICLAVRIGSCRLIDNVHVDVPTGGD